MPPRILHVIGDSKLGGGTLCIVRLAEHWQSLGWTVELLATDPLTRAVAAEAGVRAIPLDVIRREIRPFFDLAGLYRLFRFLRSRRYAIVHTHTTKAGFLGRLAARLAGVPNIAHTIHGFAFHEGSGKSKTAFYTVLERFASCCCDRVITVSRFHRDWGMRLRIGHSGKCVAVPNGIPDPCAVSASRIIDVRQACGANPGTLVILTHGRLAAEKGLTTLIRAVRSMKYRWLQPFVLLIAGEGGLRIDLERLTDSLQLRAEVRFLGFQPRVNELLAAADIVVLPSLREGLSISLLEAMAMARPIVATAIGGNREATRNGEAALLVPPSSPEALAAAIQRLAHDRELAERLAQRARAIYLEEYTIDRMLAGYQRIYLDLLSRRIHGAGEPSFGNA